MADPVSAGLMAAGNIVQGVAGSSAHRTNAKILKVNEENTLRQGVAEEAQVRDQARQVMGEQLAEQGASGFMVGTGSALDALRESGINAELDELNIRRTAKMKAQGYQVEAGMEKKAATMALLNGFIGAGKAIGAGSDYGSNGAPSAYGIS